MDTPVSEGKKYLSSTAEVGIGGGGDQFDEGINYNMSVNHSSKMSVNHNHHKDAPCSTFCWPRPPLPSIRIGVSTLCVYAWVFLQCSQFQQDKNNKEVVSLVSKSPNIEHFSSTTYSHEHFPIVPAINLQLRRKHQQVFEQLKGQFCGSYKWEGNAKISCGMRAQNLVSENKISLQHAQDTLVEEGSSAGCNCIPSVDDWNNTLLGLGGGGDEKEMKHKLIQKEPKSAVCFSWNEGEAADKWWTLRPWYHVTAETDEGFCFSQIEDAKKQKFMRLLAQNQFHGNCSNVVSKSMASSGWGYDFTNLADGLWMGLNEMRPVQMVLTGLSNSKPGVWFYAGLKDGSRPVCSTTDMYCYMLNMTNCEAKKDAKDITGMNREMRYLPGFQLYKDWLVEYETRIQSWLRKEVYDYSKTRIQIKTPCTVIHVRRADIKHHGNRKYHDVKEYIDNIKKIDSNRPHENVLLLTDDQNAIEEALREFPDTNWMYFNRTRFRGTQGGWENHFPSGDPKTEVVTLLSIYRAVTFCDSISKQEGNFGLLLLAHMERARGKNNVLVADMGSFG